MTVDELLEVLSLLASRDEGFESQLRRLAEERVIEEFESRRETGHDLPVIVRVRCHAEKICLVHDLGEGFTIAVARAGRGGHDKPLPNLIVPGVTSEARWVTAMSVIDPPLGDGLAVYRCPKGHRVEVTKSALRGEARRARKSGRARTIVLRLENVAGELVGRPEPQGVI